MQTEYAVTALLVALAGMFALTNGIPVLLSWQLVAAGVAAGLLASFIDAYRIKALIEEGAKSTVEYMSVQKPVVVSHSIGSQMVEQALMGFQKHMTKAIGKSLLAFENVIELVIRGLAGLCGLVLLAGYYIGLNSAAFFALGLWVVLTTLAVTALMKMSGVFSFAFGLVSRSFIPLNSYTKKAKDLIAAVASANCASWLLFAMQWWLVLLAFGNRISIIGVFLLYSLVTLFTFAPYSIDGIGWMELAAVVLLPLIGASAAAVFIAVVLWEITRLVGNSASVWLLTRQSQKKAMVEYR